MIYDMPVDAEPSASGSLPSQSDRSHDSATSASDAGAQPARRLSDVSVPTDAVPIAVPQQSSPVSGHGGNHVQPRSAGGAAAAGETTARGESRPGPGSVGAGSSAATGAQAGAAAVEGMMRQANSFATLRKLAAGGDEQAVKLLKWLKKGGNSNRSWKDAQTLYEKIPITARSSTEATAKFLNGKSVSHVIPRSKFPEQTGGSQRAAGGANNIEIESIAANQARGDATMTRMEQLRIRTKNALAPVAKAGAISAAVGGTISAISHGIKYVKGEETGAEAVTEVAKDTAVAGATGAGTAAVCIMCPPVATAMTAYAVCSLGSLAAKGVYYASKRVAPELTQSTEQAVVKIANDTGITTAVTYVNDVADSVTSTASKCVDGAKDAARSAARARLPTSLTTFMFGAESSPAGSAPTTDDSASPPLDVDGEISCDDDDGLSDGDDESNSETVILLLPDGPIDGTDDNVTTSATAHIAIGAVINSMIPGSQHPPILLHPLHPGDGSGPIVL